MCLWEGIGFELAVASEDRREFELPVAGVTGGYELPNVGMKVGIQADRLCS